MGSKLNDTAKKEKKDLELGFTVFSDDGKKLEFPPLSNSKYPISIAERALREYIAKGGEILVIKAEDGRKPEKAVKGRD